MTITELADHHPDTAPKTAHARSALPRRKFFSDMPDRGLFGFAAIAGFAAIVALKLRGYNSDLIAVLAVALMLIYGVAAYRMPRVQIRVDRLGDNFYYLGFIFTLASLSAALLQLRSGTQIEQLFGSFGIALVTTIVGIAGRVLFVQLRSEIDDVEEQVRNDLAATAADLRAQLAATMREFETFRLALLQSLSEAAEQHKMMSKKSASLLEEARNAQEQQARQLSGAVERINQAVTNLSEKISNMELPTERWAGQLSRVDNAVEQIAMRASRVELPSERLQAQMADFARGLEDVLRRLGRTVDDVVSRGGRRRWFSFLRR